MSGRGRGWWTAFFGLVLALALVACRSSRNVDETTAQNASEVFANGNFETGDAGAPPPSWTVTPYLNPGVTISTPETRANLNLTTDGGSPLTTLLSTTGGAESQTDPSLGSGASLRWPKYGKQVAIVNKLGKNKNTNSLSQTMTIASNDVDPSDAKIHVRFVVAPVLENPGHPADQQPYYFVQLTNVTRGLILYLDYNASAQPGVPWKISNGYYYTDWQLVDISPSSAELAVGDQVTLEVIAAGCSPGGHFGEVYVDGVGSTIPGLFVSGTGPAAANDGSNVTYTLAYQNGGTTSVAGTTLTFTTPTGTTFQSVSAPGLTCSTPAVGGTGTISCVVGSFAAAATGSLQITVQINSGVTGTLTAGNYAIGGTAVSPLLGPKIYTTVTSGVTYADVGIALSDNAAGVQWGQPLTYTLVASNPSGPNAVTGATVTDTFPATLTNVTWTCAGANGGSCAASGAGNIADGTVSLPIGASVTYTVTANVVAGAGAGQVANTASIALGGGSSDPDDSNDSAGVYNAITSANGGACTTAADCTSGICSAAGGICIPAGGCGADADCTTATQWCNTQTLACVAKLANDVAMPTVSGHAPALTGHCTTAAGAAVCVSGVCDAANDACGYAAGHGSCDATSGATLCRSGACSVAGTCNLAGGCEADGDCAAGSWCNESTSTCTPKIANGSALAVDAAHVGATLDGTCNAAAAAIVCQAGVCDGDDACGYANGDGSCTGANAGAVCRSGACDSVDGKCGYANGDGPCSGDGALCRSKVCENDGKCGYLDGDGPCSSSDATTVCRSAVCATSGLSMNKCVDCASDANCASPAPACDVVTGTCRVCTASNAAACFGTSPICNAATDTCTACTVDNGADGGFACPSAAAPYCVQLGAGAGSCGKCTANEQCAGTHAGPICNLVTGACGSTCAIDGDCTTGQWCNAGTCTAKTPNGDLLPAADPIAATCTSENGARVCASGVCDTDNRCGYAVGDGTCTPGSAGVVCRSSICAPGGTCGECNADADCAMPLPACDVSTSRCVRCSGANATACTGATPSCDAAGETCVACGGDFGSASPLACSSSQAPYCTQTGACGLCTTSDDCAGAHAGPICDPVTGACGAKCRLDTDCASVEWCDAASGGTGSCVPKLANGVHLPAAPASVASCDATTAARVCASATCDPSDDKCGVALGDGPCASDAACRSGQCIRGACQVPAVDAGAPDAGSADAGAIDAGPEDTNGEDASTGAGSTAPQASTPSASDEGADVAGGAIACAASPGRSGGSGASFFFVLGLVAVARRRSAGRRRSSADATSPPPAIP